MERVRISIYYILIPVVFILIGWFANTAYHLPRSASNPLSEIKPRPLDKYTVENLGKVYPNLKASQIEIGQVLKGPVHQYCVTKCISYEFRLSFDPTFSGGPQKSTSGVINIPDGTGPFPLVVMFRGFVDANGYFLGEGTQPMGEYLAQNGFMTIAPDFLGYGDSDQPVNDVFESRFQTWTTAMSTIKSVNLLKQWDNKNLFIWGHSNGGQIALTTLEITGASYPTVLWAPVSKPFPYSILYFTDSPGDYGKALRKELANFEQDYDSDLYSIHKYFDRIKAPISLNQGTKDEDVPQAWSDLLNTTLKDLKVEIKYNLYPGNDHNMKPNWNQAAASALDFYQKNLSK